MLNTNALSLKSSLCAHICPNGLPARHEKRTRSFQGGRREKNAYRVGWSASGGSSNASPLNPLRSWIFSTWKASRSQRWASSRRLTLRSGSVTLSAAAMHSFARLRYSSPVAISPKRSNQPVIADRRVLDCLLAESTDPPCQQVSKWSVEPLGFSKSLPLPDDFRLAVATISELHFGPHPSLFSPCRPSQF